MLLLRRLDRARDDWIRKRICSYHETRESGQLADSIWKVSGRSICYGIVRVFPKK
jgi:hypothetical protein